MPIGAEVLDNGAHFRVWAPKRNRVRVLLEDSGERFDLERDENGYYAGLVSAARPGSLYRFLLDSDEKLYPDPASRFQPDGPHGPSQIIDPGAFEWTDSAWPGITPRHQVIYEMHVGAFTAEGTWNAARAEIPELKSIGMTVLEIMPLADFAGAWGWGYDGVNLFAPTRLYGSPDELRAFIDEAHRLGMGVILDVVYNHFGPEGNYIGEFSGEYFTSEFENEWGAAINFASGPVREFYAANARYWIEEFHFDGLRLDATQSIRDDVRDGGSEHILAAIARTARAAAGRRNIYLVAENEPQETRLVRSPAEGGYGLDALWNDDFHHSAIVALTGRKEAYYTDYSGSAQEFISSAKYGYLYQGQWYSWQGKRRGSPAFDIDSWRFIAYLQNHDQVANTAYGERPNLLASAGRYRAMTALLLLGPATPMLFQGQEFGATTPFLYFCDHKAELCDRVAQGRKEFLAQFPTLASPEMQEALPDPADPSTFRRSKLDLSERARNRAACALHKDLLRLRRDDPVLRNSHRGSLDGAVLGSDAFALRYFGGPEGDRLLIVNLGRDLHLSPAPEPLLAPPSGLEWRIRWSSEDPAYDGAGTLPFHADQNWRVPGNAALFLTTGPEPPTDLGFQK